ncbi:MAG: hypothetical protein FJX47_03270 [Alphaproteobacteria bacterium]|nr:hypothetical protein [Alphaproteobacteria bacterium]
MPDNGRKPRGNVMIWATVLTVALIAAFVVFLPKRPFVGEIHHLRLGAYEGDVGALQWIAKDKGFFTKVGLEVDMAAFATGNAALEALRQGKVDAASSAELPVAVRSFTEPDLRVIADICRYWNKGLVGRRDRGVATPADLKGKRIGVSITSSAEHALTVFLALQGMTVRDVTRVDLPPAKIIEGISQGDLDAAITWQPHVAEIEKRLGANGIRLMEPGTEAHLLMVTTQASLAAHPVALRKLLEALIMAEEWARNRPEEAKRYLSERFQLPRDYVETMWPRMQLGVSLPQEMLAAMDSEARWYAEYKGIPTIPNYAETVHALTLSAIRPSVVSVLGR